MNSISMTRKKNVKSQLPTLLTVAILFAASISYFVNEYWFEETDPIILEAQQMRQTLYLLEQQLPQLKYQKRLAEAHAQLNNQKVGS